MKHFLLFCALLFSLKTYAQGSLETDRLALVALYNSTNGNNWYHKDNWLIPGTSGDNPCNWYGITCSGDRVTGIKLNGNKLIGPLPPAIGTLTELKVLNLNGFGWDIDDDSRSGYVGGNIPNEIGQLTKLEYVDFGANAFSGPIPSSIGNLTNLTYLDLSNWADDSMGRLYGYISGSIPSSFGNLTKLVHLDIRYQDLSGNLPASLANLQSLKYLNLGGNRFSGSIPAGYGNLSKLTYLSLDYWGSFRDSEFGGLTGPIPNFSGLPTNAKIGVFGNSFTFAGMESNVSRLEHYSYQNLLPISAIVPLGSGSYGPAGLLYVEAGGTLSNNTYRWYKNGVLVATNVGDEYYEAMELGTYRVEVTNSVMTKLKLTSDSYTVTHLPVTLISFIGKNQKAQNCLTWQTASQTNNSGFEIEKGFDTKNFEKIGFMDGGGDSKDLKKYSFIDENPFPVTYYRLKQIDFDGKFEYSRIIAVKKDLSNISVYPNPARNQLFVKDIEVEEDVTIRNMSGVVMMKQKVSPNLPIRTDKLANGMYTITMGEETRKFVIQH